MLDKIVAFSAQAGPGERARRSRVYAPGEILFREHDPVRRVHVVEDGLVMLHHVFPDGRRQIVDLVAPGELCSWEDGAYHGCTAEALTCCTVAGYEIAQAQACPDLQRDLAGRLRGTVARMQRHAALLGRKTALERVASLLARLAEIRAAQLSPHTGGRARYDSLVRVPLTRREMADHLGITQETVSRSLTELKRRGVISYDSPTAVRIDNPLALELLSGSPAAELNRN